MTTFHIGELHAKEESREALLESLEMLKGMPGFISNTVYVSDENPNMFTTVEEWESKQDHDNFMAGLSPEMLEQWLGMLEQPPVSNFYTKA